LIRVLLRRLRKWPRLAHGIPISFGVLPQRRELLVRVTVPLRQATLPPQSRLAA